MRRIKLTRQEKEIENSLLRGEYVSADKDEFKRIANMLEARKKDAVLNIRVNSYDLAHIKQKANKMGIKYQTFISELLHRVAQG
jgi:predicted DNA binding CopG/RHH family protein